MNLVVIKLSILIRLSDNEMGRDSVSSEREECHQLSCQDGYLWAQHAAWAELCFHVLRMSLVNKCFDCSTDAEVMLLR